MSNIFTVRKWQSTIIMLIFLIINASAYSQSGEKWSVGGNTVNGSSFIGTLNNYPLVFKINNVQQMTLTPEGFLGLGTGTPSVMFEVTGDAKFNSGLIANGYLSVFKVFSPNGIVDFDGSQIITTSYFTGNSIYFTGPEKHITSATGTVDFDGNNIFTKNTITSNNIYFIGLNKHITSATGTVDFDGNNISTTAAYTGDHIFFTAPGKHITSATGTVDFDGNNISTSAMFTGSSIYLKGQNKHITSVTGTVDFDGNNISTTAAYTGDHIFFTAPSKHITSTTGTVDFDGNNLTTTANILANNLELVNSIKASKFINPNFAGSNKGLILSDVNGYLMKVDLPGDPNIFLRGDGSFGSLTFSGWATDHDNIFSSNAGFVGIGISSPIEKLDVNGNANIRGYLYVQNGVIIGQRINSQKVTTDTLLTGKMTLQEMNADSVSALKMASVNMKIANEIISKDASISGLGKFGLNITIDGVNSKLFSTTGFIDLGGTRLMNTGTINASELRTSNIISNSGHINFYDGNLEGINNITASNINISNITVENSIVGNMQVVNSLKIGNNSLHLSSEDFPDGTGAGTNIYSTMGNLKLQCMNGNTYNTIINGGLNNSGNVGIGTSFPTEKLHVYGTGKFTGVNGGYTRIGFNSVHGFIDSDQDLLLNWYTGKDVVVGGGDGGLTSGDFYSLHNTFLSKNGGNVTIGDVYHNANLEINGSLKLNFGSPVNGDILAYDNATGTLIWKNPNQLLTEKWESGTGDNIYRLQGNVGIGISTPEATLHIKGTGTFQIGPFEFSQDGCASVGCSLAPRLRIIRKSSGGSPDDVVEFVAAGPANEYNMHLRGKIFSKEVELLANIPWPDYVFNNNYKLNSLEEIEMYIKLYKHLPEVPSAEEINENGIKIGEMNTILLKKIEELTLYSIEQNKRLKALEEEIAKLKNK